jgi:hypothetical protein
LKPYQQYLINLANQFGKIKFTHMSKATSRFVDALATLTSMIQI